MLSVIRKILIHSLGWLLLFALVGYFKLYKPLRVTGDDVNIHDVQLALSWALVVVFFYVNHLVLVPRLFLKQRYVYYGVSLIVAFAVVFYMPELLDTRGGLPPSDMGMPPQMPPGIPPGGPPPDMKPMFMDSTENTIIILFWVLCTLASLYYHNQVQLRDIKNTNLEMELSHLKNQIQPHFLFNTLNSIYALALEGNKKTSDSIYMLSDYLRYHFVTKENNTVSLEKEINFLSNYVELQRQRVGEYTTIQMDVLGDFQDKYITPLIFFSFVENAFQYGVSPEEKSEVMIDLKVENDNLEVVIKNTMVKQRPSREGQGIGLVNTRKRLSLLYPRHTLHIQEKDNFYQVNLTIPLSYAS